MPPKFRREYGEQQAPERQALLDGASDDDDFFMTGPRSQPGRSMADAKVTRLQGQVDEVVGVMQDNIGKVMDRGDRLDELQDKSENLSVNADSFRMRAKSVRNQMWWKECKMRLLLAFIVIVILLIIIVPIIVKYKKT